MAVAPNSNKYIGDANIIDVSTDKLIKVWAYDEFPWLSMLQIVPAGASETTHPWLNTPEGLVQTLLDMTSPAMVGGGATEAITVDSTEAFVANNVIQFRANGDNAAQEAYIVSIDSATVMTISTFTGVLSAHADNTPITLKGDRTQYGDTLEQPLRLPARDTNTIEQVSVKASIPTNMADAGMINGQSVEEWLTEQGIAEFKQKLTMATLFGVEKTAAANAGRAMMAGVINIIPSANQKTDAAFNKANYRTHLSALCRRGGCLGNQGIMVVNEKAALDMYAFDDSNVGISWRDTDAPIGDVVIRGVRMKVVIEPAMNNYYREDRAACITLTPMAKGKSLVRLATKGKKAAQGKIRKVLEEETKSVMQIARFATLELRDDYRHGLFVSNA